VSKYGTSAPKFKGTAEEQTDLNELRVAWAELPEKNHEFVQSLIAQFDKHGHLSEKQWYWVRKLAGELPDRQVPDFSNVQLAAYSRVRQTSIVADSRTWGQQILPSQIPGR